MNFYALNAVPINGWDIFRGEGSAELSIAATGIAGVARFGSGEAALSMATAGAGAVWQLGQGTAAMALSANGRGTRRAMASASPIMELRASGDAKTYDATGGIMTMLIRTKAGARVVTPWLGSGYIGMALNTRGRIYPKTPVRGSGLMDAWLNTGAEGRLSYTANFGQASLSIAMTGRGRSSVRHAGGGSMLLELILLRQQSRQYRLVHGSAYASMVMTIDTRTARVTTLPGSYVEAPKQRTMRVDSDNRAMRVPAASRAEQVMEA